MMETATEGLEEEFRRCFTKMSQDNAGVVVDYILSMKYEANLSDNYRRNLIRILSIFSRFCKNKPLKSMIREDLLFFLDTVSLKALTQYTSGLEHTTFSGHI